MEKGIFENKFIKIFYGVNLVCFFKIKEFESNFFFVLWVGMVSIRKGFFYVLEVF